MAGRQITLTIQRGVQRTTVSFTPSAVTAARWDVWSTPIGCLWLTLFAALIAWRRPYVPGNLLLSTSLVLFAVGTAVSGGLGGGSFAAPWAWAYIVISIFNIAFPIAVAFSAAYASIFARPFSRVRFLALWLCYLMSAASVAITCAQIIGVITLWFDPMSLFMPALSYPLFAAIFAALASGALAIAWSRGVERQRAAWSLIPLAGLSIAISTTTFVAASAQTYAGYVAAYGIFAAACFITPVVLTYVALNRRLIDIGFVLNRAVVFAFVSTIVIGAFVLAEWAASQWFVSASHATSAAIGMAVALGLGLSLRYIHRYVDHFVDRVFFRKRHDDEAALRRFAHESSYITDRTTLLERTEREVKEHTSAGEVALLIRDGSASYASASNGERVTVSENDPGILALRAWHKPVDLHTVSESALRGEFAFPMISRGELVGVLICGAKHDNEVYAPDESDALLTLAHEVGTTLGTLSSRDDSAADSTRATQAIIVEKLDALMSQVRSTLPPSVQ